MQDDHEDMNEMPNGQEDTPIGIVVEEIDQPRDALTDQLGGIILEDIDYPFEASH